MWGRLDHKRPSKRLNDLLTGSVTPEEAHPSIMKWAEFAVWQAASEICKISTRQERIEAIEKIPEALQPYVKREIKRIWDDRHS